MPRSMSHYHLTESAVRSSTSTTASGPGSPLSGAAALAYRCVMTVHNLNFLRYPHLYSLGERLVLLRLYRRMLRSASRVITVNRDAREELSGPAADRPRQDRGRDAARGAYAAESARRRRAGRRAAQICAAARFRADAGDGRAAPQSGGAVRGAGPAPGAGARDARNERGGDADGSGTD